MADELLLKWGTLKGWRFESEPVVAAANVYAAIGEHSASVMGQRDTPEQKAALCALIDAIERAGGTIQNDWTGEMMTAAQAKEYVMDYGK